MSRIVIGVEDYYDLAKTIAKISRITKTASLLSNQILKIINLSMM
jgi:hypothetical protein